ncbi:hypothetical protein [Serratia fonticola]|uniref:hypothetical protein n=1 Tax=Serratia fonticola TaxID=47917 RepID=UPI00093E8E4E|nr:hypothetical protein [Serratia fonticola]OKP21767.1 hypothetical protein BSQ40_25395 [Serratia fonticola]
MGRSKELLEEKMESEKLRWIREHLGAEDDEELDEYSNEFYSAEQAYQELIDYHRLQQEIDDDIDWIKFQKSEFERRNPQTVILNNYNKVLDELASVSIESANDIIVKMRFSYAVTILEACLFEMIKSFVLTNDIYVKNALNNLNGLNDQKITLGEAFECDRSSFFQEKVISFLSTDLLYHNISKVFNTYRVIVGTNQPHIDIQTVSKIMSLRHDVVHRDGKSKEGISVELSYDILISSINAIKEFLSIMAQILTDRAEAEEINRIDAITDLLVETADL